MWKKVAKLNRKIMTNNVKKKLKRIKLIKRFIIMHLSNAIKHTMLTT